MTTVVDFDLRTTDDWIAWRAGGVADALAAVGELGLGPELDAAYRQAVRDVDDVVRAGSCLAGGIWCPDRTAAPWGQLTLTWVVPAQGEAVAPERLLKQVRKAPKIEGTRVLDYSAALGKTANGDDLLARVDLRGYRATGVVLGRIASMVFPAGAGGMVSLDVQTNVPTAFAALAEEASAMTNTVAVVLA